MVENIDTSEASEDDLKVFTRLMEAISDMGWDIAVDPRSGDQVRGMIIGTEEYVQEIVEKIDRSEN